MEEFKGTKGKWRACCTSDDRKSHFVFAGEGEATICGMQSNCKSEKHYDSSLYELSILERNANAKLIAAAPELLKALKMCYASLCTYGSHPIIENNVEEAINKALNGQ